MSGSNLSAIASSCAVASADKSATADGAVIQVEALSFAYPDGRRALDGLSLAVREGEKVGLIGPNGAGKSTLLLHLNGILPCDGRVRVLGMKVEKPNLKAVRQSVGLVFQNPDDQLFCPTVGDDVAFGPRQLRLPEAEVAARVRGEPGGGRPERLRGAQRLSHELRSQFLLCNRTHHLLHLGARYIYKVAQTSRLIVARHEAAT